MNTKTTLLFGTLLTAMLGLTACQATVPSKSDEHRMHQHHGQYRMQHDGKQRDERYKDKQRPQLTPEQQAAWQAKREQRQQQQQQLHQERQEQRALIEKACEGKKVGQTVKVQWKQRSIQGTCEMRFNPDKAQFK